MAPRKNLRSSSSKHRRRSSSPLHHTDNRDDLQQTASAAGACAPQLLQRLPLEATEAAENRPPPAGLPGRVIPDSQESLSSLELSVNEAEDDLEYEQPAAELGDQQLDIATGDAEKTEEDLEGQQLLAEVGDSQDSFNTVDTVLVPARSKLAPTHYVGCPSRGICCYPSIVSIIVRMYL